MATSKSSQRLYWIDWARALAAFAVLVTHAHATSWVYWSKLPESERSAGAAAPYLSARFGYDAVIIFFVLSGYLVGGKLLERAAQQNLDLPSYALDRLTRIYVPYVPALLLTAAVALSLGQPAFGSIFLGNLFQLQGVATEVFALNGPLWTLSYEFWFYLSAGLMAAAWGISSRMRPIYFSAGLAALCVFTVLKPFFLMCWLIGAVSYRLGASKTPRFDAIAGAIVLVCV
jgi:peptidoglycan/LPS O-acetylase OafA/YrhL